MEIYCYSLWGNEIFPTMQTFPTMPITNVGLSTQCTVYKRRQTDRHTHTAWQHSPRLHSIARQKLCYTVLLNRTQCIMQLLCDSTASSPSGNSTIIISLCLLLLPGNDSTSIYWIYWLHWIYSIYWNTLNIFNILKTLRRHTEWQTDQWYHILITGIMTAVINIMPLIQFMALIQCNRSSSCRLLRPIKWSSYSVMLL